MHGPQLLRLLRRLLSQANAMCAMCTEWLLQRLLFETAALHRAAALLRPQRLLPETVQHVPATLLAGLVFVR